MTCMVCKQEIIEDDARVVFERAVVSAHLCCWLKGVASEIANNSFAFQVIGQPLAPEELFKKTVSLNCKHGDVNL